MHFPQRPRIPGCVFAGLLTCSSATWAHGTIPGANFFYNGLFHPLLAPAHLLSLIALALLAGQHSLKAWSHEVIGLCAGLLIGSASAYAIGDPDTDRWLWAFTLGAALCVIVARRQPAGLRQGVGLLIGLAVGIGSADAALHGGARIASLAGSFLGALVLVAEVALLTEWLVHRRDVAALRIGVRVVASWITACALLMLALAWKKGA